MPSLIDEAPADDAAKIRGRTSRRVLSFVKRTKMSSNRTTIFIAWIISHPHLDQYTFAKFIEIHSSWFRIGPPTLSLSSF